MDSTRFSYGFVKPVGIMPTPHMLGLLLCSLSLAATAADELVINGLFRNKAIVTIDGQQRVLKQGVPGPEGVLLIESNSEQAVIEINGERDTYKLSTRIGNRFRNATSSRSILIAPDAGGMYTINGAINGASVDFVVDTGASVVSMNSSVAKRLGIDYRLTGRESVSYTASGKDRIYVVNLKRVRIGEIELRNIAGAVHEGNFPVITLLGMSFLGKLDIKREGRLLELEKKY